MLAVRQQPGMGRAGRGAQTWRRGLGRVRTMYEGQMNWCMQIYVRSGGRDYWDFEGHMIIQNVAAGVGDC